MQDGSLSTRDEQARRLAESMKRQLGRFCSILVDPDPIGLMLNASGTVWADRLGAGMSPVGTMPAAAAEPFIGTVASTLHSTVTRGNPILECELPRNPPFDGARFEAMLAPVVLPAVRVCGGFAPFCPPTELLFWRPRPASAKKFPTPTGGTGVDPAKSSRRCGRKAVLYTLALLLTASVIPDRAQASLVTPDTFAKLAAACAPSVAPETLAAVARTKSGFDDTDVHDNTTGRTYRPATRAEAIALATELVVVDRHLVDLGLMQINSANLADVHLTITDAFDPCHSLTASARVLVGHHVAPATGSGDPQPAERDSGRRRGVSGIFTEAALTALIARCAGPSPPIDLLTRIVMHESGGNPTASNVNRNGSIDYGLAQINSSNLVWLGETPASILDPCRNIAAEARILRAFSGYATGSPARGFVLKPPGQSVSYVESLADTKYRGAGYHLPGAAASPQQLGSAKLISMSTK
jgi:type IV secretion system protein VirB1